MSNAATWPTAKIISGHAIVPEWPSIGGTQRVMCADEAEAALRYLMAEVVRLMADLDQALEERRAP
jgi:hypothetical protein